MSKDIQFFQAAQDMVDTVMPERLSGNDEIRAFLKPLDPDPRNTQKVTGDAAHRLVIEFFTKYIVASATRYALRQGPEHPNPDDVAGRLEGDPDYSKSSVTRQQVKEMIINIKDQLFTGWEPTEAKHLVKHCMSKVDAKVTAQWLSKLAFAHNISLYEPIALDGTNLIAPADPLSALAKREGTWAMQDEAVLRRIGPGSTSEPGKPATKTLPTGTAR